MDKYLNSKRTATLENIGFLKSLESGDDELTTRCKFNFHYFTQQDAGQDFSDWSKEELVKLLEKLKNYSETSLSYWRRESIGKGRGHVLEIYGKFPEKRKTDFIEPKHIPIDVEWGRFRLENSVRLIGFIIPNALDDKEHEKKKIRFDKNTFYIVFLDREHKFYKSERK